jgi:hypothetical protein
MIARYQILERIIVDDPAYIERRLNLDTDHIFGISNAGTPGAEDVEFTPADYDRYMAVGIQVGVWQSRD